MKCKKLIGLFFLAALILAMGAGCGGGNEADTNENQPNAGDVGQKETYEADNVIESVFVIGTIGLDGSKPAAIAVEYSVDLTGAQLSLDDYEVYDYGTTIITGESGESTLDTGSDPGVPTKIYVNDACAISESGGSGTGNYVIIEVNTDYTCGRYARTWGVTMVAGIKQLNEITTDTLSISPSEEWATNYYEWEYIGVDPSSGELRASEFYNCAYPGTYSIEDISAYELHLLSYDVDECDVESYEPFHATHCYDEANGEYWDFDLPYALYVPEDYDASKEYALILHIHDAGSADTNPMLSLCEAQGPANYVTDEFQQLFRDQGLGGAIVVCPSVSETFYMDSANPNYNLRITRDNWTISCAGPAILQLMDSITEEYSVDMNRIYGTGQSMGGMATLQMAAYRDNYFAALLPMSSKWGTNFNKECEFGGQTWYNAPADGTIIWTTDSDGNEVDYNNWFYLISDDNILNFNSRGQNSDYIILFHDLCGVDVACADMDLTECDTNEARSALVNELVSAENYPLGLYQVNMDGGVSHMSAWCFAHDTFAAYEWLAQQTRETEMAREKLDINKPFVYAEVQLNDELHEGTVPFPTGQFGAGTIGFNCGMKALGSSEKVDAGWTPETIDDMRSGVADENAMENYSDVVINGPIDQAEEQTEGTIYAFALMDNERIFEGQGISAVAIAESHSLNMTANKLAFVQCVQVSDDEWDMYVLNMDSISNWFSESFQYIAKQQFYKWLSMQ